MWGRNNRLPWLVPGHFLSHSVVVLGEGGHTILMFEALLFGYERVKTATVLRQRRERCGRQSEEPSIREGLTRVGTPVLRYQL